MCYRRNVWKMLLVVLTILCYASGASYSQKVAHYDDPLTHFKQGKHLYEQGLYSAAQDMFQQFQTQSQHFSEEKFKHFIIESEFLYAVSAMMLQQKNAEKLLLTFVRKHDPDPMATQAMIEIGDYYYNEKDYKKALSYYKKINLNSLSQEKQDNVQFHIAYSNFIQKDFRQARSGLEQLKNTETEYYYPAIYYKAMSSYFLADYDEALADFRKVEESRRYSEVTPYYITQILYINGEYDKVINYAQDYDKKQVRYKDKLMYLLGAAYYKQGKYDKALSFLEQNASNNTLSDEEKYQLAYTLYKSEKYKKAATLFKDVSGNDGELGQTANFYLADALLKENELAEARVAFANASRLDFNLKIKEEALFNYGKLSAELNYDREAVNSLKDIKISSPYYAESQEILSDVFLNTKDYQRSIEIIEEMTDKSPEMLKAYQKVTLYRGLQLYNDNRPELALSTLEKSLSNALNSSEKAEALFWKGQILHERGEFQKSSHIINQYFTVASTAHNLSTKTANPVTARYLQGYNYFKMNEYKVAESNFSQAIKEIKLSTLYKNDEFIGKELLADALLRAGDALFKRNEYIRAKNHYEEAIEVNKSNYVYATYQTAIINGLQGNYVNKIVLLTELAETNPKSPYADDALLELAKTYMSQNKNDKAIKPLRTLVKDYNETSPLLLDAYLNLGLIAYNQGDTRSALGYYKKVFDYNPSKDVSDEAMTAIQEIYINDLGDPASYVTFIEEVRGTSVKSSEKDSITFRVAEIAYEGGNYDKAISNYTNYLDSYPKGIQRIEAHYKRAESHSIQKEYQKALLDYEYVVTRGQSNFYNKALEKAALISYNYTEDFNKAARYYAILEKNALNEDQRLSALLGGLRAAARSSDQELLRSLAIKVSTHPKASNDDLALAQFYLGKNAYENKKYDDALNAFNQVTKYSNNAMTAESKYLISKIYFDRKEYDIAEKLVNKSYQESSNYPKWVAKSLLLLSDILIKKNDLFNARAALEAIIDNYKEDPTIIAEAQDKLRTISNNKKVDNSDGENLLEMED